MESPVLKPLTELSLDWDLFHTQADAHLGQVYMRLRADVDLQAYWEAGWRLSGELYGPQCSRAHTLPAKYAFIDQGSGATLLARVNFPDPCFWSAEIPALYQASLQLTGPGQTQEKLASFGMRSIPIKGRKFFWNTEPWILKATSVSKLNDWTADQCRQQSLALIVNGLEDSLLEQASQLGIWIVASVAGNETEICQQLIELTRWPAVCMAVIDGTISDAERLRSAAPNLILGQWIRQQDNLPVADWSQFIFADLTTPEEFSACLEGCSLPVVAVRSGNAMRSPEEAIQACQDLEKDLAKAEELAGYVII